MPVQWSGRGVLDGGWWARDKLARPRGRGARRPRGQAACATAVAAAYRAQYGQ